MLTPQYVGSPACWLSLCFNHFKKLVCGTDEITGSFHCREQRVTLFCMALLVGISIMAYNVLKLLPLPVLYGLVLYLGVSSLYGIQFIQRFVLFFIPNKHRPDFEYLRHIPNRKIYIFTAIQIVFLLSLCMFQVYFYLRVIFPLMVSTIFKVAISPLL